MNINGILAPDASVDDQLLYPYLTSLNLTHEVHFDEQNSVHMKYHFYWAVGLKNQQY